MTKTQYELYKEFKIALGNNTNLPNNQHSQDLWYSQSEVDELKTIHQETIKRIELKALECLMNKTQRYQSDIDQLRKELEQNIQFISEEYESGQCKDLDEGLIKLKILNDSTFDMFSQTKEVKK